MKKNRNNRSGGDDHREIAYGHGRAVEIPHHSNDWWTVLKLINTMCGVMPRTKQRFPGSIPVSMMRQDIATVFFGAQDYVVNYKSDGERLFLLFTMLQDYPVAVVINRRLKMLLVPIVAPSYLYAGTLLDAEFLKFQHQTPEQQCVEQRYAFEIMDLISIGGDYNHRNLYYTQRMDIAAYMIRECIRYSESIPKLPNVTIPSSLDLQSKRQWQQQYKQCQTQKLAGGSDFWWCDQWSADSCFHISVKPVLPIQKVQHLCESIFQNLQFSEDGAIMTCVSQPYTPYHNPQLFKIKLRHKNTCDFMVVIPEAQLALNYPLYEGGGSDDIRSTIRPFQDIDDDDAGGGANKSPYVWLTLCDSGIKDVQLFSKVNAETGADGDMIDLSEKNGVFVEMRWDFDSCRWCYVQDRPDRSYANSANTIANTCRNLMENLDFRELYTGPDTIYHPDYKSPLGQPQHYLPVNGRITAGSS